MAIELWQPGAEDSSTWIDSHLVLESAMQVCFIPFLGRGGAESPDHQRTHNAEEKDRWLYLIDFVIFFYYVDVFAFNLSAGDAVTLLLNPMSSSPACEVP